MRVRRVLAMSVVGMVLTGGCDSLSGARQNSGQVELINDLAARLDHSRELTYAAEYQLTGGRIAEVLQGQSPARSTYAYPGGRLTLAPDLVMDCRGNEQAMTCTLTLPPTPTGEPAEAMEAVRGSGLLPSSVVIDLLYAAALDSDADVKQHDSTIAGQHATCVDVSGVDNAIAAGYVVCVTSDGVLGSFTGTINGKAVELMLTSYRDAVPADAFSVPSDARVVDQRGNRP